jgi:hypothetical protein
MEGAKVRKDKKKDPGGKLQSKEVEKMAELYFAPTQIAKRSWMT